MVEGMASNLRNLIMAMAGLAAAAEAQDFVYNDFSSVAGLTMLGNAAQSGNLLRVTAASGSQVGAVYYDQPVRVDTGFDTVFTYSFNSLGSGGADGMTIIFHTDPRGTSAMGSGGGEMGYGANTTAPSGTAITNSLVLELDTWFSSGEGDLSGNELSLHTNGSGENNNDEQFSLGQIDPGTNLSDGQVHTVRLNYIPGTLEVYLDDLVNPRLSVPYDFGLGGIWVNGGFTGGIGLLSEGRAYVGFTAGTGGAWENHDVLSWSWSSSGGPGTAYCFGDSSSMVCPCGNVSAFGEGCSNSSGAGAMLRSVGTSSVVAADLALTATQLPAFKPVLFLQADTAENNGMGSPWGDGLRCLGANPLNLQVVFSDVSGAASTNLNLVSAGNLAAGQGKAFQVWFRDQLGPCSTGRSTSNGLFIQFSP